MHYYTQFHKTLWGHGGSNPWEKPGTSNAKTEQWRWCPGKSKVVDNINSLWTVKLMMWISNLSLHLVEITRWNKYVTAVQMKQVRDSEYVTASAIWAHLNIFIIMYKLYYVRTCSISATKHWDKALLIVVAMLFCWPREYLKTDLGFCWWDTVNSLI